MNLVCYLCLELNTFPYEILVDFNAYSYKLVTSNYK